MLAFYLFLCFIFMFHIFSIYIFQEVQDGAQNALSELCQELLPRFDAFRMMPYGIIMTLESHG